MDLLLIKYIRSGCESSVSGHAATVCALNGTRGIGFHWSTEDVLSSRGTISYRTKKKDKTEEFRETVLSGRIRKVTKSEY